MASRRLSIWGLPRRVLLCATILVSLPTLLLLTKAFVVDTHAYIHRGVFRFQKTPASWYAIEKRKQKLQYYAEYQGLSSSQLQQQLPVWVLSLARATERRAAMLKQLKAAGIYNYKIIDAVDASNMTVSEDYIQKYIGTDIRWRQWVKGQAYHRGKIATDLSHYKTLEAVIAQQKAVIVIEDDAVLTKHSDWYELMLKALQGVPQDWDILYLNACNHKLGRQVSQHVAVLRDATCTWGYVATPWFARLLLSEVVKAAKRGHSVPVDLNMGSLIRHQETAAYIANPPLISPQTEAAPSLLGYGKKQSANISWWEWYWIGFR